MVSLEELVSLVTRGTPRSDFPDGERGHGREHGVVPDAGAREAKTREDDDGVVKEPKTRLEVGGRVGDGVQEQKQQQQRGQGHEAGAGSINGIGNGGGGKVPPATAAAGRSPTAAEEPSVPIPAASVSLPPPSSWFQARLDDEQGAGGVGRERPLPAEVRWAFMWLLDSVFFSVKEPVEGLDRHPSVHALLEDLLAVRACVHTCTHRRAKSVLRFW